MKKEDKEKINDALYRIRQFKYQEDEHGGSEYKRGMASVAELILDILNTHGLSYDYQSARDELIRRSK